MKTSIQVKSEELRDKPARFRSGGSKKRILSSSLLVLSSLFTLHSVFAQTVGINATGAAGNSSAMLDVNSTTSGFLLPRMTTTEMNAISSPAASLMVFNTTTNCLMIYSNSVSAWQAIYCPCSTSASFTQNTDATFNANTRTNVLDSNNAVTLASSQSYGLGDSSHTVASTTATIAAGTYNFITFTINSGDILTVTGSSALIIYSTGAVTINGTLKLNGSDGVSGREMNAGFGCGLGNTETSIVAGYAFSGNPSGGAGGAGASSLGTGGSGSESGLPANNGLGSGGGEGGTQYSYSGGGGGYGTAGGAGTDGNTGGPVYGTAQLSPFVGGSGGGAGAGDGSTNDGGAGGGGGGAVEIIAPSITIGSAGVIEANGGAGGGGAGAGGGGAGGAIWLISPSITNNGIVEALGGIGGCASPNGAFGGNGGNGRIRLEYFSSTGANYMPTPGYTGSLTYASSGTTRTAAITPTGLCSWGTLIYNVNMPAGTKFTVDVLSSAFVVLQSNVSSGTNLSDFSNIASQTSIVLRGNFSTTNTSVTPTLYSWSVNYTK